MVLELQQSNDEISGEVVWQVGISGSLSGGFDRHGGGRRSSSECGGGCRGGGGCSGTGCIAADGRGTGTAGCEGTCETSKAAIEVVVPAPTAGGDCGQAVGA